MIKKIAVSLLIFKSLLCYSQSNSEVTCENLRAENYIKINEIIHIENDLIKSIADIKWLPKTNLKNIRANLLRSKEIKNQLEQKQGEYNIGDNDLNCIKINDGLKEQLEIAQKNYSSYGNNLRLSIERYGLNSLNVNCIKSNNCVNLANIYHNEINNKYPDNKILIKTLITLNNKITSITNSKEKNKTCKKNIIIATNRSEDLGVSVNNLLKTLNETTWLNDKDKVNLIDRIYLNYQLIKSSQELRKKIENYSITEEIGDLCDKIELNLTDYYKYKKEELKNLNDYLVEQNNIYLNSSRLCSTSMNCIAQRMFEFNKKISELNEKYIVNTKKIRGETMELKYLLKI